MKRWLLALCLGTWAVMWAQAPASQEVVLSASAGSKLGIAIPAPSISVVDAGLVERELHSVVVRDLEEAGPFAVLKNVQPKGDGSDFRAWMESGADWLLSSKVGRINVSDVEVIVHVFDVKSGKSVINKRYTGESRLLRRIAHTISDDLVARLTGEKGIATSRLVFVRQTSLGVKEIFQMDRDGASVRALTSHKSLTLSPTVSPMDGRLAYVTYKGGTPEIWGQMKAGGPDVRLYPRGSKTDGHCFAPAWSSDGKRIAFVQGDRRGNSDILVLDVESGRVRRLTDSNCINTEPSWNPTGNQIAFTSDREGSPQVYLMEDDGSNVRRLTREGNYNASPCWSPFGGMIAYVSRFEGKFDLFVYKLGEGKAYQITTGVASAESPSWSPDERRIAFSSGSRGGMQLYTTDLSGNNLRRLTDFAGCQSPKWTKTR